MSEQASVTQAQPAPDTPGAEDTRPALGLALAGGGFRASLFHLGVFRRLAELDLLRRVEMISAVSGGSIVAAHYALLLRRAMGPEARELSREEYLAIVDRLERDLVAAIRKNLRVRLLSDPLSNLVVMLTHRTLGSRMVRLYEHHIFRPHEDEDGPDARSSSQRRFRRRRVLLSDLKVTLPGSRDRRGSLATYNLARRSEPTGSAVPALLLNATTLNSGGRFTFSVSEIGDSRLGMFRRDELGGLLVRKRWLQELSVEELSGEGPSERADETGEVGRAATTPLTLALVRWLRAVEGDPGGASGSLPDFVSDLPRDLAAEPLDLGWLQRARLASRVMAAAAGDGTDAGGGWQGLLAAMTELDGSVADRLRRHGQSRDGRLEVAAFIEELYLLRAAERVSPGIEKDWARLSLGAAVGASAAFPPVFPPVVLTSIYDDAFVAQLGLTDGGVFDNTGIEALVDAGCTSIIASDTGGVFRAAGRVNASRARMMGRMVSVLRDVGAVRQREGLRFRRRLTMGVEASGGPPGGALSRLAAVYGLKELVYFHIDSPPVTATDGTALDRHALAALRTDLDSFGDVEVALLTRHGYDTAGGYVTHYYPEPSDGWPPGPEPGEGAPGPVPPDRAARVLRVGRSRFFRCFSLLPRWVGNTGVILVLAALIGAVVSGVSLTDAGRSLVDSASGVAEVPLGFFSWLFGVTPGWLAPVGGWLAGAARWPFSLAAVLAVALVAGGLAGWRRRRTPRSRPTRGWRLKVRRVSGMLRTRARGALGNVLWLLAFAPLFLALLGAIYAFVGLGLNRLFLHLTKHP